jgi:CRISPR-associated protein Cas1
MSENRIFFKGLSKVLPSVKDRWTPLYFERGRLEQENYSIRFVGSDGTSESIPVAQVSCILLGPGTTVTHAVIVSCSRSNTPLMWVGEDGLAFYAFGVSVNERCNIARAHAELYANVRERERIARKMYGVRFGEEVKDESIDTLRGKEGYRVRELYSSLSKKYGVHWEGRNSSGMILGPPDGLNRLLNIANYKLYSLCLSAIVSMGYIPSLGFIHSDGKIPFVYDIADMYKEYLTIDTCFKVYSERRTDDTTYLEKIMKERIIETKFMSKLPKDLKRWIL